MAVFSIMFVDNSSIEPNDPFDRVGQIRIGSYVEHFEINMTYWSEDDYIKQWKEAIVRILDEPFCSSCLIASMYAPAKANYIFIWPLYRQQELVYVQNTMLILDELVVPFDESNPYQSVGKREIISTDTGMRISEWTTTIRELDDFLRSGQLQ